MDVPRQMDPFERLDINVIAIIVELLNPVDIVRLRRVNHNWNAILNSEYICRVALLAHFLDSTEALQHVEDTSRAREKEVAEPEEGQSRKRRKKETGVVKYPPVVLRYRRATFRLHTRSLAKPTRVHKYRLHHVTEKSFAATSTHLFWAESNRNIWVQTIGEGVGGRRSLRLRTFGDTIAHLYQVAATESGLVIVLYREVATWMLVLMAIEHKTDRVVWKSHTVGIPMGLNITDKLLHYAVGVPINNHHPYPAHNFTGLPSSRHTHVFVHSLEDGRILHSTLLQAPMIAGCSVIPGSYMIYPPSKPTRIFACFDSQAPSGNCRSLVRVYTIDGMMLYKFGLDRPPVDMSRYRPDLSLRFTILPGRKRGDREKIMLLESTSRPQVGRGEAGPWKETMQNNPVLSAWTINPDTYEVEEVRKYFSSYAENEKTQSSDVRDEMGNEYSRLECLDPVSGISYIYYDENKNREPLYADDDYPNGAVPVRAWYETGGARIDSMTYEEKFRNSPEWFSPIKQEQLPDSKHNIPNGATGSLGRISISQLVQYPTQTALDWAHPPQSAVVTTTQDGYPLALYTSPLVSPAKSTSSASSSSSSAVDVKAGGWPFSPYWGPIFRQFHQVSRHKLVQPDIMRRRRRQNLGEDEEDWQLLPVRTGPVIIGDLKTNGGKSTDGRFVFLLAKCSGWSITCFVLDFQPDW